MSLYPECIPCIIKQSLNSARTARVDDEKIQIEIMLQVCRELNKVENFETAPAFSSKIQNIVKAYSGIEDPYSEIIKSNINNAKKYIPYLRSLINKADDKLKEAVRSAILGNIIDVGANPDFDLDDEVKRIGSVDIVLDDYNSFKEKIDKAEYVLYIGDNSEESLFDRLLIEQLQPKKIIFAVRDSPILNDITMEIAMGLRLNEVAEVISSGSKIAGTDLKSTNNRFNELFKNAPVVIAKGQGNYETLENCSREIFFMFKVKCEAISRRTGYKIGTSVLLRLPK